MQFKQLFNVNQFKSNLFITTNLITNGSLYFIKYRNLTNISKHSKVIKKKNLAFIQLFFWFSIKNEKLIISLSILLQKKILLHLQKLVTC